MNKSDPIFYVHRAHSDSIMTTFFHFRFPPPPPPVSQRHFSRSVLPSVMHATKEIDFECLYRYIFMHSPKW